MSSGLISLALFLASQAAIVAGVSMVFAMIGKVNQKLPVDQQISYLGRHPFTHRRIFREYRRLYPSGRLVLYFYIAVYVGVGFLGAFVWQFGFFG